MDFDGQGALAAVIRVGDGRGFVVEERGSRVVITAAHCLPYLPPALGGITATEERTYWELLARIGEEPSVAAECLFADPVGDIAVLGTPDTQEFPDEAAAYDELVAAADTLTMANTPAKTEGWLLSLDGEWFKCIVQQNGGPLWIFYAQQPIVGGMSGSPILGSDGAAIGVVCASASIGGRPSRDGGPNPRLSYHLPGWMLH